jgi:cobyrinic acid a,c-diamide synthase
MIIKTEQGKRLSGFFLGKVKKHLPHGICKIYIPGVYPETFSEQPDRLPDAI